MTSNFKTFFLMAFPAMQFVVADRLVMGAMGGEITCDGNSWIWHE